MTEFCDTTSVFINKLCRGCLKAGEDLFIMDYDEAMSYQNLIRKVPAECKSIFMYICVFCKRFLAKFTKFSEQCRMANDFITQIEQDNKYDLFIPSTLEFNNLSSTKPNIQYLGPECDDLLEIDAPIDDDKLSDRHNDDDDFDDDELPLSLYKNSASEFERPKKKKKKKKSAERKSKNAKKAEKEMRPNFTSRMVQETDVYIVIKLSKEEVLKDLEEKRKAPKYTRSLNKCEKCAKGFNFQEVLENHMERHSPKSGTYKCDICDIYCPSAVSLRGHIKSHTTRYKCKQCDYTQLARQHVLEHHSITHALDTTLYRCDGCPFTTLHRTIMQRHVRSHLPSGQHPCDKCGKLFKSQETLRVHTLTHDKSKRCVCKICDRKFIYPSLLHSHIEAVHNVNKGEYYCVECDVQFLSKETLKLHFRNAIRHRDTSQLKYECPDCSERFFNSASLSIHSVTSHGAVRRYHCEECNVRYATASALRSHNARVHRPKSEGVKCEVCNKTFSRKSVLTIHMRRHTGARPHACADCDAAFAQRATLVTHCHARHGKKTENKNGFQDCQDAKRETVENTF